MENTKPKYFPEDKKPELIRLDSHSAPGNLTDHHAVNSSSRHGSVRSRGRSSPTKPASGARNGTRPVSASVPKLPNRPASAARPLSAAQLASTSRPLSGKTPIPGIRSGASSGRPVSGKNESPTRNGSPKRKGSVSPGRSLSPSKSQPASAKKKAGTSTKPKAKSPTLEKTSTKPKLQSQLSENKVIGQKSSNISNLTEDGLKIMDMSSQGMTAIPTTIISNPDLGELNLSCNNLRSLPTEISGLINLRKLDLSKNGIKCMHQKDFSGLPAELGQLKNLRELYISECNLPFVPPAIWALQSLTVLDLSRNKINVLLPEIGSLTSLKKLNLQQTSITCLPSEIAYCQDLEELLLYGNVMDSLPETLADMPRLRVLAVNYRSFCNIVDSYMENLIRKGQINSEHIPLVVFELPALENLDLECTKINTVPEMFMDNLQEFSLYKNFIYDMPETICKCYTLQVFDISKNFIRSLPSDVAELTNLTVLKVNDNMLEKMPNSIGKLVHLEELEMGGNKIRIIPTEIKNLSRLRRFVVDRNDIQFLPEEVCTLRELETLDVTQNCIKQLPISLYNLTNLTVAHCYKGLKKHGLWLYKNPLSQPPEEVWKTDKPQDIFNYLKKLKISQTENLQRQKILIIGSQGAGKSSLMDALVFGRARSDEKPSSKTKVLEQVPWRSENGVDFLVYDLAGDDVYTTTYPLFLDHHSLVLLVYDSSKYEDRGYYESVGKWLDLLHEHIPGNVVKIVGTKNDLFLDNDNELLAADKVWQRVQLHVQQREERLEDEVLRVQKDLADMENKLPENKDLLFSRHQLQLQEERLLEMADKPLRLLPGVSSLTSSEGLYGVEELVQDIEICAIDKHLFPHAQRYIPDQWNKLCAALKKKKSLFLQWDEVADIAIRFQVKDEVVAECIQYLHDVGEVFWFKHIPLLKDILFHRPRALIDVICSLYRHDTKDFLTYDQTKIFSSKGGLTPEEFERTISLFFKFGQISRPLLNCFWFYLKVNNQIFDEFLELLPKLNLCYTIPEPFVPSGKCYLTPLVVLPWFNTEKLLTNQLQEVWPQSIPTKTKQVMLHFSLSFSDADGLFYPLILQAQDLLVERTDWQNAVLGKGKNGSRILIRKTDTDNLYGGKIEICVRDSVLTNLLTAIREAYSLIYMIINQRPGLYCRVSVSTENCNSTVLQTLMPENM
ncbi:malignant fibrous histiocytoma-amplified sequence 1 homolog isoform X2 [Liolophura sinensis]|uniref:malignant fibrous histiocytoma-amplified sequence 1 homolog isoform X2 n=1 Tax=Liolophura sinensis TaxID=3198878 RepID=UPI0031584E79